MMKQIKAEDMEDIALKCPFQLRPTPRSIWCQHQGFAAKVLHVQDIAGRLMSTMMHVQPFSAQLKTQRLSSPQSAKKEK